MTMCLPAACALKVLLPSSTVFRSLATALPASSGITPSTIDNLKLYPETSRFPRRSNSCPESWYVPPPSLMRVLMTGRYRSQRSVYRLLPITCLMLAGPFSPSGRYCIRPPRQRLFGWHLCRRSACRPPLTRP